MASRKKPGTRTPRVKGTLPSNVSRERLEKALAAAGIKVDVLVQKLEETKKPRKRKRTEPPKDVMESFEKYFKGGLPWSGFVEAAGEKNSANMAVRCLRWKIEGPGEEVA